MLKRCNLIVKTLPEKIPCKLDIWKGKIMNIKLENSK